MRFTISFISFFFSLICFGQLTVDNHSPHVATDFKKYLYVGFDNPIYITGGNVKALKVSVDNGTIASTGKKGYYLVKPTNVGTATVKLEGNGYKKEFRFDVWPMRYPEIRLVGIPNDDGMIEIKRYSDGIAAFFTPADVDIHFGIDSFTIEVKDSLQSVSHVNRGALWDSTTKQMIQEAKSGTRILIHHVYMTGPGRKRPRQTDAYLESYVW